MQSLTQRTGWFFLAIGGLWTALAAPAYLLAGLPGLEGLTYAALLCFVPGLAVIYMAADCHASAPREVWFVFGGTLLRMMVGLGGALAVRFLRPELNFWEFLVWLVIFYSVTLFFEIFLILKPASIRSS
jgi:hypothetical protein